MMRLRPHHSSSVIFRCRQCPWGPGPTTGGECILVHNYLEFMNSRGSISNYLGSDLPHFNLPSPNPSGSSQAQPTYFPQNVSAWTPDSITGNNSNSNSNNNNNNNAPHFNLGATAATVRGPR